MVLREGRQPAAPARHPVAAGGGLAGADRASPTSSPRGSRCCAWPAIRALPWRTDYYRRLRTLSFKNVELDHLRSDVAPHRALLDPAGHGAPLRPPARRTGAPRVRAGEQLERVHHEGVRRAAVAAALHDISVRLSRRDCGPSPRVPEILRMRKWLDSCGGRADADPCAMSGLVLSLWLAMQIEGSGRCPAAGEVEGKLAPLLPPGFASSCDDRAVIAEDADGSLSVALSRPDGRSIASRRLPPSSTCAEQAETVAVTLAVWEAQIHPEISLRLDRLAAAPASTTPRSRTARESRGRAPAGGPRSAGERDDAGRRCWRGRLLATRLRRSRRTFRRDAGRAGATLARAALGGGAGKAHAQPASWASGLVAPVPRARRRLRAVSRDALGGGIRRGGRTGGRHRRGLRILDGSRDPEHRSRGPRPCCGSTCASELSGPGSAWRS